MPSKRSAKTQYRGSINSYERIDGMILTADTREKQITERDPTSGKVVTYWVALSVYGQELDKILSENPQEWSDEIGFWSNHADNGTYNEAGEKRSWFVFDEKGRGYPSKKAADKAPVAA